MASQQNRPPSKGRYCVLYTMRVTGGYSEPLDRQLMERIQISNFGGSQMKATINGHQIFTFYRSFFFFNRQCLKRNRQIWKCSPSYNKSRYLAFDCRLQWRLEVGNMKCEWFATMKKHRDSNKSGRVVEGWNLPQISRPWAHFCSDADVKTVLCLAFFPKGAFSHEKYIH